MKALASGICASVSPPFSGVFGSFSVAFDPEESELWCCGSEILDWFVLALPISSFVASVVVRAGAEFCRAYEDVDGEPKLIVTLSVPASTSDRALSVCVECSSL